MNRSSVLFFYHRGMKYEQLLRPECWDCGAVTDETAAGALLRYYPRCRACSDRSREARLEEMNRQFDQLTREHEAELRVLMMKEVRSPGATQTDRAFALEVLADLSAT